MLLEKAPVVLWATDRDLRITASVGAGLVAFGLQPGQAVGTSLVEHARTSDERSPGIAAHLSALRGEARDLEVEWHGRALSLRTEPLRD